MCHSILEIFVAHSLLQDVSRIADPQSAALPGAIAPASHPSSPATQGTQTSAPLAPDSEPPEREVTRSHDSRSATRPIVAIIVASAVFYFAREILLPLAMASVLAIILSPLAARIEQYLGRLAGAAIVVGVLVMGVVGIGYFLTLELTSTVAKVSDYSHNIAVKIAAIEESTPAWLQRAQTAMKTVQEEVQRTNPQPKPKQKTTLVQSAPISPALDDLLRPVLPLIAGIAEALLTTVLLFFLLYGRKDLRDRLVRLGARVRITITAQAIDAAGNAISHYLMLFSLMNLGFGIAIGVVGWMLGLPNPELWGAVAFLLRFVPYVGALTAAILPSMVAVAVFPGWGKSIEVFGAFILLDQVAAQLIEPFLIGNGIGVSPVALLVSAMYWGWIWGPFGLLLSVPLTACLKVAGDYIEEFDFFSLLFGAEAAADNYQEYYRRLLEMDKPGARTLALRYCDSYGLEATFDDVLVPAIIFAGHERAENHISAENEKLTIETTFELVNDLAHRVDRLNTSPRLRALGMCAPGEQHSLDVLMLLAVLYEDGITTRFIDSSEAVDELRKYVRHFAPDVVCVSCIDPGHIDATADFIRGLKADWSKLVIVASGPAAEEAATQLLDAGCTYICASRSEGHRVVRAMLWNRADVAEQGRSERSEQGRTTAPLRVQPSE
jgi:predicted PurR-regulated permease PerM